MYHPVERSGNESRTNWRNIAARLPENVRLSWGAIIYTERVGGSSPSAPTAVSAVSRETPDGFGRFN